MSCNCNNFLISIKHGESLEFAFNLMENGVPMDLTEGTIKFQVREYVIDDGVYLINKTITSTSNIDTVGQIISPANGQFVVKINSSDTASLSTLRGYFLAIYYEKDDIKKCISANSNQIAQFIVLNP